MLTKVIDSFNPCPNSKSLFRSSYNFESKAQRGDPNNTQKYMVYNSSNVDSNDINRSLVLCHHLPHLNQGYHSYPRVKKPFPIGKH